MVEDRPVGKTSAKYRLPVIFGQICATQQSHGLFATAKLLVKFGLPYIFPCRPLPLLFPPASRRTINVTLIMRSYQVSRTSAISLTTADSDYLTAYFDAVIILTYMATIDSKVADPIMNRLFKGEKTASIFFTYTLAYAVVVD